MPVSDPAAELQTDDDAIAGMDSVQTILQVICRTTGLGFSAVARVTSERWVACAVRDEIAFGLRPGGELEIASTLCNEVRASDEPIVIEHVAADAVYCEHHTPRRYGFQSYISFPIHRRDGRFFGTLCAIDPKPAQLKTPAILDTFRLFAELISLNLEALDRAVAAASALQTERRSAELREEFIGVLGAEIRNPLNAIVTATAVLKDSPAESTVREMTAVIERSASRMNELTENVLDLARRQLGGGLNASVSNAADLALTLNQVIAVVRADAPGRTISSSIELTRPVLCERSRIEQMLSHLVRNALQHGDRSGIVEVTAFTDAVDFVLSVANTGLPIPPGKLERIFLPSHRTSRDPHERGLGLGLYLCAEIARAHRGSLTAECIGAKTVFTFRMPTGE